MSLHQQIRETVYSDESELKVDEAAGVIRGVRILGEDSVNNREYAKKAREDAIRLYADADIYIDHQRGEGKLTRDRGLLEGFGIMRNPRFGKDDAVIGDLHYLKSHAGAPVIVERAQRFPRSFGLSHDAAGEIAAGKGKNGRDLVEALTKVNSIDLVKRPATNKGLFEDVTLRAIVARFPTAKDAKRLAELIEGDMAGMADTPAAVDDAAGGDVQIAGAFETLLLTVFRDAKLTPQEKAAKFKVILGVQDAVSGLTTESIEVSESIAKRKTLATKLVECVAAALPKSGDKPATLTEDDKKKLAGAIEAALPADDPAPAAGEAAKLKEAEDKRLTRLETAERRQLARDLVESDGRKWLDLTDAQRKLLEKQPDEAGMKELLESWPKKPAATDKDKPRIGSRLKEEAADRDESYDKLRDRIRPKAGAKA